MLPSDLPTDEPAFRRRFWTEDACRAHLFKFKWPDGFRCGSCGDARCYRLAYECSACGRRHALLAGTIFEQTKTPLTIWFAAIYWFIGSKGAISALELKRHKGFKSDQTAWTWLHKLRRTLAVQGAPLEGRSRSTRPFSADRNRASGDAEPVTGAKPRAHASIPSGSGWAAAVR